MKHSMYKKISTAAVALCTIASLSEATAQTARNITMDEAIQMSLQSSKQLKYSQAKIDEAKAQLQQVRDNRLPDVKASGSYLRVNNPTIETKIKLGGSSTTESKPGTVDQAAYGLVNATLPLFSGLRIHYGIAASKYLEQAAQLDAQYQQAEVIQNTIAAFSNLYKARKAVALVNENLKQSQQRVTDFSNLEQNGLIPRNDLLKSQLEESNIELSLLDAEDNLRTTYINMDLMLGLPEGTELAADTNSFQMQNDAGTLAGWEQTAMQNRKDIAALNYREKASDANIRATKGEYYPGIALTGGYVALDIPNLITVTNALNGGIGLQYNLGTLWKTGAKVAQAQAQLRQTQASQGMLEDQVRLQVNQAFEAYLLSQKKIDVYSKAIAQAQENYKITKNKYDNTLATTTDLLDADVAQLQAQLNYSNAKADAIVAYKSLLLATGSLNVNTSK